MLSILLSSDFGRALAHGFLLRTIAEGVGTVTLLM